MKQFSDKVAVITGAASGIGRGLAKRCAEEKMKVVIADVDENTLIQFQRELNAMGAGVLAVAADVSKQDDVDTLAKRTLAAYGAVHLVFNNAGVYCEDKAVWEYTLADWQWLLSVNFWGVLHGIRTFVPIMLDQDMEGHIVNTSSIAGLASYHGSAIYKVTKHAILSLSETLYHDLAMRNSKIRVSVICPGQVSTNLRDSERLRPSALQNEPSKKTWSNEEEI
ncbi:MAG: SDR family NAD(P)-dependent oxidoreductase, partial [Dehalococcoidia bacterium]